VTATKLRLESKVATLRQTLQTIGGNFEEKKAHSDHTIDEQAKNLLSINGNLTKLTKDFMEEDKGVKEVGGLLSNPLGGKKVPQDFTKYSPVPPFNVKPGAFMVADRDPRDSNNGFHELSARIANLARQINRVAAV